MAWRCWFSIVFYSCHAMNYALLNRVNVFAVEREWGFIDRQRNGVGCFSFSRSALALYGVHLGTKIIENKRQFEVQKLDYPCRNLVIWIWNRNERSRNRIVRSWSYFEQVEIIKGKLDIADVEVQITIPTKMQIHWCFSIIHWIMK